MSCLITKWHVHPAKTPVSLGLLSVSSEFPHQESLGPYRPSERTAKTPVSAQRRLWWDWADAQADLSLRWAQVPFRWFCQGGDSNVNIGNKTRWHQFCGIRDMEGLDERVQLNPCRGNVNIIEKSSVFFETQWANSKPTKSWICTPSPIISQVVCQIAYKTLVPFW